MLKVLMRHASYRYSLWVHPLWIHRSTCKWSCQVYSYSKHHWCRLNYCCIRLCLKLNIVVSKRPNYLSDFGDARLCSKFWMFFSTNLYFFLWGFNVPSLIYLIMVSRFMIGPITVNYTQYLFSKLRAFYSFSKNLLLRSLHEYIDKIIYEQMM